MSDDLASKYFTGLYLSIQNKQKHSNKRKYAVTNKNGKLPIKILVKVSKTLYFFEAMLFELLPEDLATCIFSFLDFHDLLLAERASKRMKVLVSKACAKVEDLSMEFWSAFGLVPVSFPCAVFQASLAPAFLFVLWRRWRTNPRPVGSNNAIYLDPTEPTMEEEE